ncbi:hypothetical protein DAEQUDRAFT_720964 [Daedalea quercina L-15889]|uniref:Uncharacterized protein n=1 Tax=Daedalea quercina L-15889 TaxID=1314783 RepID=A0A165TX93_9APHY|nr:hypothetical protein DAEQUDRAFT_720964 [Daedalea quercina L-15889]
MLGADPPRRGSTLLANLDSSLLTGAVSDDHRGRAEQLRHRDIRIETYRNVGQFDYHELGYEQEFTAKSLPSCRGPMSSAGLLSSGESPECTSTLGIRALDALWAKHWSLFPTLHLWSPPLVISSMSVSGRNARIPGRCSPMPEFARSPVYSRRRPPRT